MSINSWGKIIETEKYYNNFAVFKYISAVYFLKV